MQFNFICGQEDRYKTIGHAHPTGQAYKDSIQDACVDNLSKPLLSLIHDRTGKP